MNIAAYCRVSTEKEAQLDSLSNQKEFFTAYAQRQGHTLVRLYADAGISGTSLKKREAFRQLLLDAEKGLFQQVVVKDVSRFARNTVDALQSIRKLKSLGIHTLFLTASMDTMGDSEFILTLFSAMAQEESGNLSKRVKWGKKINAEKGRVPREVFGYRHLDVFTLAIDPEEARVVREIFSLYVDHGLGCRTISQTLNQEGAYTKHGCQWNPRGVRRVLVNPIYCGVLVNHKYEVEDFLTGKQVLLPQQEQFLHPRPQWAIIPPERFQQAQAIMALRREKYDSQKPHPTGRYSGKHLFSGMIKCAHCGRSFTRKSYTYVNTRIFWRCVTNDQYTAEHCDNRICLEEPDLMNRLASYLVSKIPDMGLFSESVLEAFKKRAPSLPDPEVRKQSLEARRRQLLAKADRYRELFAAELLTMEALKEKLQDLNKALEENEEALRFLTSPQITDNQQNLWSRYREEIRRFFTLESWSNQQLRQVLAHISVQKDGTVRLVFKQLPTQTGDFSSPDLANWRQQ